MRNKLGAWYTLALLAVVVAGALVLAGGPAEARPSGPQCGWSTIWDCTLPDGSHHFIGGTRCDAAAYERQTGATCVPSGL